MLYVGGDNIRKIFKTIFLVFLVLFKIEVKAKTYGLEYKPIETLDLKVEEVKKYRFYKENKIEAYFIEDDNPLGFKKQDSFKYTDYSEWFKNTPTLKKNREVKEREVYIYSKLKKIKHFYIEVEDPDASVLEFAILFNGLSASNSAYCGDCTNGYYMNISDGIYDNPVRVNELAISYQEYYLPNELSLRIMFNKENINYRILIFEDNINEIMYEVNLVSDLELHEYTIDDFDIKDAFEEEVIKYNEEPNMYLMDSYKEYAYRDKLFLYEYKIKDYYPTYELSLDGYIKDESDYIVEKKYYYLETAIIKDKIVINSENYDLSDYIKTSIPFETASNIDISKNGTYKIKYIFPTKTIEHEVKVDTDKEYIESLKSSVEKKNDELKEVIENKNEIIERLESSIKNKDEIISKKQVERTVAKSSKLPIILVTIGIMLIVICIIKSLKKTVELKK